MEKMSLEEVLEERLPFESIYDLHWEKRDSNRQELLQWLKIKYPERNYSTTLSYAYIDVALAKYYYEKRVDQSEKTLKYRFHHAYFYNSDICVEDLLPDIIDSINYVQESFEIQKYYFQALGRFLDIHKAWDLTRMPKTHLFTDLYRLMYGECRSFKPLTGIEAGWSMAERLSSIF